MTDTVIVAHGPVTHGVECYEAWRNGEDCPHEAALSGAIGVTDE